MATGVGIPEIRAAAARSEVKHSPVRRTQSTGHHAARVSAQVASTQVDAQGFARNFSAQAFLRGIPCVNLSRRRDCGFQ